MNKQISYDECTFTISTIVTLKDLTLTSRGRSVRWLWGRWRRSEGCSCTSASTPRPGRSRRQLSTCPRSLCRSCRPTPPTRSGWSCRRGWRRPRPWAAWPGAPAGTSAGPFEARAGESQLILRACGLFGDKNKLVRLWYFQLALFFCIDLLRAWSTYLFVPNLSSFQVWRQTGSLRVSVGLSSTRTRSYKNIFSPNKLFYAGI